MILIDNKEGLVGDFLGTIPAMQALHKDDSDVVVKVHPEAEGLFDLIKGNGLIKFNDSMKNIESKFDKEITFNSSEAFGIANTYNWYMTQAFMKQAGLEVPEIAPKAKLNYGSSSIPVPTVDYLISPFARSLPLDQKWQREKWQELVTKMKDKTFGVLGNYKYDDPMYLNGKNVRLFYSLSFDFLCRLFINSKALISVVTGTSHLAFHLGLKNILLTNQFMTWGNNPEAIKLTRNIHDIQINEVIEKL